MSQRSRRLAAVMFTDIVGYTSLGQRNESLSLAVIDDQRKLLRPIFGKHNGREVKTMGDAFLIEFPSALDAVRCAYDIQRTTREFNISLPEERRLHLRIGVHLGDVVESKDDILGDAVNVASRIQPLAEDGGVCLSRQVFDHVENKFELPLESLGIQHLNNVSTPVEVYKIVMPWNEAKPAQSGRLDKKRVAERQAEVRCALCSKPVGDQPIRYDISGQTLYFDNRECFLNYRKLKGVYGNTFR